MRRSGVRATAWGAVVVAAALTGSLLGESGAAQPTAQPTATGSGGLEGVSARRDTNRPNILVIMTDDQRRDDLMAPWMRRTRDLIAQQGVRFKRSFAPTPLCAPARASFLTGLYPHNHRVLGVGKGAGDELFNDRNTLPVWLKRKGYRTAYLGKYMNGYGRGRTGGVPERQYVPPGWTDWHASLDGGGGTYDYFDTRLADNGSKKPIDLAGEYQTTAYGQIGRRLIRENSGMPNPFFLTVSFTAPHFGGPREPDDRNGSKTPARDPRTVGKFDRRTKRLPDVDGEPGNRRKPWPVSGRAKLDRHQLGLARRVYRQRAESLSSVDKQVARFIETLRQERELGETYVVFTSDNGYLLGQARHIQGKVLPYEPSLTTPMAVRGPGIPKGKVRDDPFMSADLAPTVAAMAHAKVRRRIDGQSMLGVAKRGDRGWKRPIITTTGTRKGRKQVYGKGIRVPGFLYAEYVRKRDQRRKELYDLRRDPDQLTNVAGRKRYRFTQRRLARMLHNRKDCSGAGCRRPYVKYRR